MNDKNIQKEIKKNVLEKIRGGGTHMHSRAYFITRVVTTVVVAALTLALSVFVLSFIGFSLHESGEAFLLGFGGRGIFTFLTLFPWPFLIFDIMLLFLLEWLLRGFKFGYHVSLLSVFFVVFAGSLALAFLVNLTPFNRILLERADNDDLPIVGNFYEGNIRESHEAQGIFKGIITSIQNGQIVITNGDNDRDINSDTWTVFLPTNVPQLSVGDQVYVFGSSTGRVIQAFGIRKLSFGR